MASTTPSTAASKSAESNTTKGDFPPNSRDNFLPEPAVALRRICPTSVEPETRWEVQSYRGCVAIHRVYTFMHLNKGTLYLYHPNPLTCNPGAIPINPYTCSPGTTPVAVNPYTYSLGVIPVNPTLSTSGCVARACPKAPFPVTTLKTPGGKPASAQISANKRALSRV